MGLFAPRRVPHKQQFLSPSRGRGKVRGCGFTLLHPHPNPLPQGRGSYWTGCPAKRGDASAHSRPSDGARGQGGFSEVTGGRALSFQDLSMGETAALSLSKGMRRGQNSPVDKSLEKTSPGASERKKSFSVPDQSPAPF